MKIVYSDNNEPINIIYNVYDNVSTIKNKIFVGTYNKNGGILNHPKFLLLEVKPKQILQDNEVLPDNGNVIRITNIVRELVKIVISGKTSNPDQLYDPDSQFYEEYYHSNKQFFKNLDFQNYKYFCVPYSLHFIIPELIPLSQLSNYLDRIHQDYLTIKKTIDNNVSKTKKINYSYYTDTYSITSIINTYKIHMDTNSLINYIKLDNIIPLIYTYDTNTKQSIVKVYKQYPMDIIKKLIMNENGDVKHPKGFKLKLQSCANNFVSVNVYNNKIVVRYNWHITDFITLDKIIDCFDTDANIIFNRIQITKTGLPKKNISFHFYIKRLIPFGSFVNNLDKNVFSLVMKFHKKIKSINLIYIPSNVNILIKLIDKPEFLIDADNKIFSIDVSGVSTTTEISVIIEKLIESVDISYTYKPINNNTRSVNNNKLINKELKNLVKKDINIDFVSCQKKRKPVIKNGSDSGSNETYSLTYKGTKFICKDDTYKYPGFTSQNVPCCFKKDQRQKDNYKLLIGNQNRSSNSLIINKHIITTDKILQENRLGILPESLTMNNYYRLGVVQDTNAFLNALFIKQTIKSTNLINLRRICSRILKKNIIIINTETNQFVCDPTSNIFPYTSFIVILWRNKYYKNFYEPVIKLSDNNQIQYSFTKQDPLIKMVLSLIEMNCQTFVNNGSPPPTAYELSHNLIIYEQFVNRFQKVIYLNTNFGILPVFPTDPLFNVKETSKITSLKSLINQWDLLIKLNLHQFKPIGQLIDWYNKKPKCVGILLQSGLITPVIPSKIDNTFPIISNKLYYKDIDFGNNDNPLNARMLYTNYYNYKKELYQRLRFTLSKTLDSNDIKNIKAIINGNGPRQQQLSQLKTLLEPIMNSVCNVSKVKIPSTLPYTRVVCNGNSNCNTLPFCIWKSGCKLAFPSEKMFIDYKQKIYQELLSDPKQILEQKILPELTDNLNYLKRQYEIVLLGNDNIKKYFLNKN